MAGFLKNKYVWRFTTLILLDAVLFCSTNSKTVSSFVVMVGFILLMITIYYLVYGFISLIGLYGFKVKHRRQKAIYITGLLALVVALQSSGELSMRDVWVLLPLVMLGYFYSTYARRKPVV